jgi:ATP-dependent DNA ligase
MEGIVAKRATGPYAPEATSWVKFKNRAYSRTEGERTSLMAGIGRRSARESFDSQDFAAA